MTTPHVTARLIHLAAAFATFAAGCSALIGIQDLPPGCIVDADCNSGDPCAVDSCGSDGLCARTPKPESAGCVDLNQHAGTCLGGECVVKCTPANVATACDEGNACTADSCAAGLCVHQPLDGEVAAVKQTVGDCKHRLCAQGVVVEQRDDSNIPVDGNPCHQHLCTEGQPTTPPQDKGASCGDAMDPLAKVCDGAGSCVQCNSVADCTHLLPDTDCHTATCVEGKCVPKYALEGTVVNATLQTKGDCHKVVCDGAGETKSIVDDTNNLPAAPNDCIAYTCTNGVLTKPPVAKDAACGPMGKPGCIGGTCCDGAGTCVGCNSAAQCGTNTDCQTWACVTQKCVPTNATKGTVTVNNPPQKSGNCQQLQCDGTGGVVSVANDGNLPADDGTGCTTPTCSNGTASLPPKTLDTVCMATKYCDGNGKCVACNNAGQCTQPPDCQVATCKNNACGVDNVMQGQAAKTQTGGDCQKNVCDGMGKFASSIDNTDAPACNNNACVSAGCNNGNPTCTPLALGTQVANKCDAATGCANAPCACNNAPYPNTACLSKAGAACAMAATCISGFCTDSVCCNAACNGACDVCDATGTCKPNSVTNTTNPGDCDANVGCASPPCQCDGGAACRSQDGVACANGGTCASGFCVNAVCCKTACTTACAACSKAKGAMTDGTCQLNAVVNMQDAGRCDDTNGACNGTDKCTCDPAGNCKAVLGEACTMGTQCASGFCADGVCCDTACATGCSACSVAKGAATNGTCAAKVVKNQTDPGGCDANNGGCGAQCSCDAGGNCLRAKGQACATAGQCATGFCPSDDLVCCDSACNTKVCSACSMAKGASADGTCTLNAVKTSGPDPSTCHDTVGCPNNKPGPCYCDPMNGWCCNSGGFCYTM
jgi:hypothetical protein